jgi:hypothetical protein
LPVESAAVTVIVSVPAGVPGVLLAPDALPAAGETLDPPQPDREIQLHITTMGTKYIHRRYRFDPRTGSKSRNATLTHATGVSFLTAARCVAAEGAVVVIVSLVLAAAPLPGLTEEGANVQVAKLGRVPQEKLTMLVYPPTGVIVSVAVTDCPAVMVAVAGEIATVKSGAATTIDTAFEVLGWFSASPA